ncbi:stem-specific protein TSJT1-like isoform X2 [Mangifera indica]|uniref:stem-specific protein TSJT1-like isoform X2 n=1 Tax=Mangifera indica TaxID=29780 RepID=UPI001CF99162|nr:stem-specific protein TSJT1-like isoform X2 [Mangifera indica]
MLAIFNKGVMNPPEELHSPASLTSPRKPKLSEEICKDFVDSHPSNTFLISLKNAASLAYVPPQNPYSSSKRLFCGIDNIYCIFMGSLNNLSHLNKQYGLSKGSNEAMFVIEAYRTLRDRGPYPAHQVLTDLDGSFGFMVYDSKAGSVFAALGSIANEEVRLFWGIAGDGSVVISHDLEIIKAGCAKSFAPFPTGCMFHSEQGLMSFEHPGSQMKPMPRIDSEGVICGANFKVDVQSRMTTTMPRVGSEANWALSGNSLV